MSGDPNDDENSSEVSDSAAHPAASVSPRVATGWVVPSLESDLEKRADSLRSAIERAEGDYMDFLSNHQNELVVFFAIASEILDELGRDLFTQKLLADDFRDDDDVNEYALVEQLSGPKKFDLLNHYGILSDDLASDIERTRRYRARLVHDPQKRHRITDLNTLHERIETAIRGVKGLQCEVNQ